MKNFVKNNVKLLVLLSILIVLGLISATLALTLRFGPTNVDVTTANVVVNVRYEKDGENNDITSVTSTGELLPTTLDTSSITNITNATGIIKYKFWISGDSSNPENSIYDIALNNINIDCELKSEYVKWLLYKNNNLLSSGNLSPSFDAMPNNRMVLTTTQENLTTTEDEYLFVLYIEESCSGDISTCANAVDQSSLLGRSFSANIGIETSTKTKKTNTRTTSTESACITEGTTVTKPICKDNLVYDGTEQTLFTTTIPTGVTVNQSAATTAGEYTVTASLATGYKWNDETTEDYIFTCKINKRSITISTQDQTAASLVSDPSKVNVTNLVSGHTINSIHLSTISTSAGDVIVPSKAIIYDSNNNDVTNNYTINYQSTGKYIPG